MIMIKREPLLQRPRRSSCCAAPQQEVDYIARSALIRAPERSKHLCNWLCRVRHRALNEATALPDVDHESHLDPQTLRDET